MQKITLDLDALAVESFDTAAAGIETRGTVDGHALEPVVSGRPYLSKTARRVILRRISHLDAFSGSYSRT